MKLLIKLALVYGFYMLAIPVNMNAQTRLIGKISDATTQKGIAYVRLYIPDLNFMVFTDTIGLFTVDQAPSGIFTIELYRMGYHSLTLKCDNIKASDNNTPRYLYIKMQPSVLETPEVVVTGISRQLPENTSYNVATLSKEEIQNSGAITLTDALAKMPGVSQISTGGAISKPVIRGLYGNRIVTIYQGIRFDNQQWQDEHGLGLSDVGVDHVELIKGPASLLFGSEAIGGVINIMDEKPAAINTIVSDLNVKAFSNTEGMATEYGIKGATEDKSWRIRGGLESHADYLDGNNKRIVNTRFNGGTLKAGMSWYKLKRLTTVDFTSSVYKFGYVTIDNGRKLPHDVRFSRSMKGPNHMVNYHILSLQNIWFLKVSTLKLNIGLHVNNRQEQENGSRVALNMILNTLNYDLKWIKELNKSTSLTIGSQGMGQSNTNFGSKAIVPDAYLFESSAFTYLQKDIGKLSLEGGLRYDVKNVTTLSTDPVNTVSGMSPFSKVFSSPNGSIGAVYHVLKNLSAKINGATGYRSPNLAELSSNGIHEGTYRFEFGDPNLKHEQSIGADGSLAYESKYISFQISAFYNNIKNFVYLSRSGNDSVGAYALYKFLQSDAALKGGEAYLDIRPPFLEWLDWYSTYSTVTAQRENGTYLPFIPANKLSSTLRAEIKSWKKFHNAYIKAGVDHVFAQNHPGDFESSTAGYTLFNAGLAASFISSHKDCSVSLTCTNLLNTAYIDHMSRFKPLGINNMGRNIILSLHIPLSSKNINPQKKN